MGGGVKVNGTEEVTVPQRECGCVETLELENGFCICLL